MDERVDAYIARAGDWRALLEKLRGIIAKLPLEETVKWGAPCYTQDGAHIVGMLAFKSYAGLWFPQGALLDDPHRVLTNAQTGKTKAQRQWRFTDASEVKPTWVKAYIREAMQHQAAGRAIQPSRNKPVDVPPELATALAADSKAKQAFAALTVGKQRDYAEHISAAKRADTRERRLQKVLPMIAAGKGLNDRYRK